MKIKMRYWHKGVWYYIDFQADNLAQKFEEFEQRAKTTPLELWTGFTDKNKVEIYAGDKIKAPAFSPQYYTIKFIDGAFVGVYIGGDSYPVDLNLFFDSTGTRIEVIGNIYHETKRERSDETK